MIPLWAAAAAILAVSALAAFAVLRVQAGRARTANLHLRGVLPLGPKERLVVVEHRGRDLLLGVTAERITLLDANPAAPVAPPAPPPGPSQDHG